MHTDPQPTLDGTPPAEGTRLWGRFLDQSWQIIHAEWLRAVAESGFVGMCECGGYLVPDPAEELPGRFDYHAACSRPECRKSIDAPGGRVLRRSSAHGHMPTGWMENRFPKGTKTTGGS